MVIVTALETSTVPNPELTTFGGKVEVVEVIRKVERLILRFGFTVFTPGVRPGRVEDGGKLKA